jgi:hypothetical protein
MELVDYALVDEELTWFDIPGKAGAKLGGPPDLTGKQTKQVIAIVEALDEEAGDVGTVEAVFRYYLGLPETRWNLAQKNGDGTLHAIELTPESVKDELRRADYGALTVEVTRFLFPFWFGMGPQAQEEEEDITEGLEMEPGSQAAEVTAEEQGTAKAEEPDPNAEAPQGKKTRAAGRKN